MINQVMKDASEIIHYRNARVPLYVKFGRLSNFSNMEMLCHWHEDLEYVQAIEGNMMYHVNGEDILIAEGDAILINSKHLHYGYSADGGDCTYLCILFQPQLFCGNSELQSRYVNTVLTSSSITYQYFSAGDEADAAIISQFQEISRVFSTQTYAYELHIISLLAMIWKSWLTHMMSNAEMTAQPDTMYLPVLKRIVEYIYTHYSLKLSLNELAAAGGICRSKCCQIFKKYLNKTPMEFVNTYRLEVSMELLRDSKYSITEIAYACGFHSSSYFSETFMRYKGCTPSAYRGQTAQPA